MFLIFFFFLIFSVEAWPLCQHLFTCKLIKFSLCRSVRSLSPWLQWKTTVLSLSQQHHQALEFYRHHSQPHICSFTTVSVLEFGTVCSKRNPTTLLLWLDLWAADSTVKKIRNARDWNKEREGLVLCRGGKKKKFRVQVISRDLWNSSGTRWFKAFPPLLCFKS